MTIFGLLNLQERVVAQTKTEAGERAGLQVQGDQNHNKRPMVVKTLSPLNGTYTCYFLWECYEGFNSRGRERGELNSQSLDMQS